MDNKESKKNEDNKKQFDLKKEWESTKKVLYQFGKEVADIAKKGEKEMIKFSKRGKLHVDSTALTLKMERLYYMIGKEYVHTKEPVENNEKLKKLIKELKEVEKEQDKIEKKLHKGTPKEAKVKKSTTPKKATKKKTTTKKKTVKEGE